jgi:hypothetical protein
VLSAAVRVVVPARETQEIRRLEDQEAFISNDLNPTVRAVFEQFEIAF